MTPACRHLVVQVVALARALADAGKHRHAAVQLGDVVDQLHDHDGLAHAGTAERADLAALQERADQVDHLDAGREHLGRRRLIDERGRRAVNRVALLRHDGSAFVDRAPVTSSTRPMTPGPTGIVIGPPLSLTSKPRLSPSVPDIEMVRTQRSPRCCCTSSVSVTGWSWTVYSTVKAFVIGGQRVRERDVHHRTDDLHDRACVHTRCLPSSIRPGRRRSPAVPA